MNQPECNCSQCRTMRYQEEHGEYGHMDFQDDFNDAMDQGQRDMGNFLEGLMAAMKQGGMVPPQQHIPQPQRPSQGQMERVTIEKQGNFYMARAVLLRATLKDGSENVPIGALSGIGGSPQEAEEVLRAAWNSIVQYGGV